MSDRTSLSIKNDELRRITIEQLKIIETTDKDICGSIEGGIYKMSDLCEKMKSD